MRMSLKTRAIVHALGLAAVAGVGLPTAGAVGAGQSQVVVQSGDASPDGNGTFRFFQGAVLNDAGQAAFQAVLTGTNQPLLPDTTGLFVGDGVSPLAQTARQGQAAPGGLGPYSSLSLIQDFPAINNAGQIAFFVRTSNNTQRGVFVSTGPAGPIHLVDNVQGDQPALNNAGQVAYEFFDAIYLGDGLSPAGQLLGSGQALPDNDGTYNNLGNPSLNDAGQVAFRAMDILGAAQGFDSDTAVLLYRGANDTVLLAREDQASPVGSFVYDNFDEPVVNDQAAVAFKADLRLPLSTNTASGVFVSANNGGAVSAVAAEGGTAPDGNGSYDLFSPDVAINDAGQVAFKALLAATAGGSSGTSADNIGLFIGDGTGSVEQVVRRGQAAPDGNGVFSNPDDPALNDAGQAAFIAPLTNTLGGATDDNGLFFYDPSLGLIQVVREGDAMLGSTVTELAFNNGAGGRGEERSGLNNAGQVAYSFELADGTEGVAIWTVPEPSSLAALGVAGLLLSSRRRRG
jgi:hypothetical protein